jgi:hypothetical protein
MSRRRGRKSCRGRRRGRRRIPARPIQRGRRQVSRPPPGRTVVSEASRGAEPLSESGIKCARRARRCDATTRPRPRAAAQPGGGAGRLPVVPRKDVALHDEPPVLSAPAGACRRPWRSVAFVDRVCVARLYGRAGRLAAQNGVFRPRRADGEVGEIGDWDCDMCKQSFAAGLRTGPAPTFTGLASFGPRVGIFWGSLYSVPPLNAILGLDGSGPAPPRPQVRGPG